MSCTQTLVLIGALALSGSAASDDATTRPPDQTLQRLDDVTKLLDDRDFDGSYQADVVSWQGPPDDQTERRETYRAHKKGLNPVDGELVSAIENGRDITETRRAEIAELEAERDGEPRDRPFADFRLPGWENREAYSWESLPAEGGTCAAGFAPAPDLEGEEGVGRGQLAWHCESLDPSRMSLVPAKLPRLVDETAMSWSFARADGFLLSQRFEWEIAGGLPFFKRRFRLVVEISEFRIEPRQDVHPQTDEPSAPGRINGGSGSNDPRGVGPDPR